MVEAGFKAYDTNGDGVLNSNDNGYLDTNNNGMHDTVESLTPKDTNSNGVLDAYELDADSDTCLDVYEAGFTDLDNDGDLDGTGLITLMEKLLVIQMDTLILGLHIKI